MLIQGWAIALSVCSAGILFLGLYAVYCGIRVLRYWDQGSDSVLQIQLESETWLSSALMQYAMFFQLLSLLLLVLAADSFSSLLIGAMCATGAFLANEFGLAALFIKIILVFFSGSWLLLHRLDLQSEEYPLVRLKYLLLLFVVPLLLLDSLLQSLYIGSLEPDVITSCCGVVFRPGNNNGYNLLDPYSTPLLLTIFYSVAAVTLLSGAYLHLRLKRSQGKMPYLGIAFYACCWVLFFVTAIWSVTVVFSSYIYAMPFHRCPFDILQPEYNFIGYPLYLTLFAGTFFGLSCGVAQAVRNYEGLAAPVRRFQSRVIPASMWLMVLFLVITAYAPLRYLISGGEF